ncbi:hypothetical protein TWF718_000162 [Orbilia javanica]|uniref:Uncharacterized protein n=1 Tax=Orbilia javanica TaxID=47235 RepID=A0AAN8P0T1_9PEZI
MKMEQSPPSPNTLKLKDSTPEALEPDAIPFDSFMPWHLFWRDAILRSLKPEDYEYLENPGFDTDLSKYSDYHCTNLGTRLPWADDKKQVFEKVRPEWRNLFRYFEQAGWHKLQIPEKVPKLLKMAYKYGCLERRAWSEYRDLQKRKAI